MPRTQYTKSDGRTIAYQVWGDGPIDLVLVWGTFSHVEVMWDDDRLARWFERLGRAVRVIHFDRVGVGLSERTDQLPTLEGRMDDLHAVLAAVGSDRVALFGESEGAPTSILFTATHPALVSHLVLYGPLVRMLHSDDFPSGLPRDLMTVFVDDMVEKWGEESDFNIAAPDADDERRRLLDRFMRMSTSPKGFRDTMLANFDIDIRPILATVTVPTLVIHKTGDALVPVGQGRYLAEHISGATLVELDGNGHYVAEDDPDLVASATLEFLTGHGAPEEVDRVLSTVLFTDIVDSTQTASSLGDRRWRELLDDHDQFVRREVERHRGRLIKTTGDGALATFDGPARAVRGAQAIVEGVRRLGVEVRAGVHTGEVELRGDDVGGIGVHIGARVSSLAAASQVLVSRTVVDLVVGSGIDFEDAGVHALKGVPGDWQLFAVAR